MIPRRTALGILLVTLAALTGCERDTGSRQFAFIVNSSSDFWTVAKAGIRKAEKELGVTVDFQVPGDGTAAQQQQIIEASIAKGVDGMAVSVLDPKGAISVINEAAKHMPVITQDSDCPDSNRKVYIGTDNVEAGRQAGLQILAALSDGGTPKPAKIALFVGKLDVANARERKQGIEEALKGTGIEIVETFTDETKRAVAQNNVRDALDKYPDLKALVGLWSYNTPAIVQVLEEKGLTGNVKVVGFDEEIPTLEAIEKGVVYSTIVQQPYEFGYLSIKVLAQLASGEDPKLPENKLWYVPVKVIEKSNVADFRKQVQTWLDEGRG